jgi:hypothetical protein
MMTVLEEGPKHQANHNSEVRKGDGCASDENGVLGLLGRCRLPSRKWRTAVS